MRRVQVVVCGSVAVNRTGAKLGKGAAFVPGLGLASARSLHFDYVGFPVVRGPICVTAVIEVLADGHVHIKLIWVYVLVHNPGACLSRPRGGPGLFSFTSLRAAVAALGPGPQQPVPGSVRGMAPLVVFAGSRVRGNPFWPAG
jgi:hypothetical protein